jgi:hypothetical protein
MSATNEMIRAKKMDPGQLGTVSRFGLVFLNAEFAEE